jgi:hypothetical protein
MLERVVVFELGGPSGGIKRYAAWEIRDNSTGELFSFLLNSRRI